MLGNSYGAVESAPARNTSRRVLARAALLAVAVLLFACAAIGSVRVESVEVEQLAAASSSKASGKSDDKGGADIIISPMPTYEQKEKALREIARLTREIAKATRERVSLSPHCRLTAPNSVSHYADEPR